MQDVNGQKIPSARKDGLVVQTLGSEVLVYDTERHKAHSLNANAALIWGHCDGKRTLNDLTALLKAENSERNLNVDQSRDLVLVALDQLEDADLLETKFDLSAGFKRMSRRQLMKAAGVAALVAIPVVSSIVAPTAAHAATCLPSGAGCTTSAQCCSGLCSGGVCA
jgi:hypothetical protein